MVVIAPENIMIRGECISKCIRLFNQKRPVYMAALMPNVARKS